MAGRGRRAVRRRVGKMKAWGKRSLISAVRSRAVRNTLGRRTAGSRRVFGWNLDNNNLLLYEKTGEFFALSINTL